MAQFSLSPSVAIRETDLSKVVPSVATAIGAYAGMFAWGPAFKVINLTSENQLKEVFGGPTEETGQATDWFCAADYLSYASYLKTVRVVDTATAKNAVAASTGVLIQNDTVFENNGKATYAANKVVAKYPGTMGNGLSISFADSDTFATWKYRGLFSSADAGSYTAKTTSFVGTGNTATGSTTLSNIVVTSGELVVGMPIVGGTVGIPVGATIASITNSSTVELSVAATAPTTNNALTTTVAFTGSFTTVNSSKAFTALITTTGVLRIGSIVTGTGIPTGTYVTSISGTTGTLSNAATASGTAVAMAATVAGFVEVIYTWPGAPSTSAYVRRLGGRNDELHGVVVDTLGTFSGTKDTILEKFTGLSKAFDAKTPEGISNYFEDVINRGSQYIYVTADEVLTTASADAGAGVALFEAASNSKFGSFSAAVTYTLTLGVTGNSGVVDGTRIAGYAMFANQEEIDVTLVVGGVCSPTVASYINDKLCTSRKDCIGGISPPLDAVFNNTGNEERDVIAFRNVLNSSTYIVCDTGWKQVYDRYNDKYRWVPLNPSTMGLCASVDSVADTWWSPAGFNRGFIKNVIKLAWNPSSKATRDNLYQLGINPVVTFPGVGTVLYGDKTMVTEQSAFSRINVRRLFILLEKSLASYSKFTLFEFNDAFTRTLFKNTVTPYLRDIQGRRGIYDFKVVVDEVNTPDVIDANGFRAKFLIKPARSINFIELSFVATATGANFNELV